MIFLNLALECTTVHAFLVQAVLLIVVRIIAELTTTWTVLVAILSEEQPAVAVVLIVSLMHERVVEVSERNVKKLFLCLEWRVETVCSIDRNAPCCLIEVLVHLLEESLLELL